jgi:hypothetical protein
VLALGVGACGGDDDDAGISRDGAVDALAEGLAADSGLTDDQSRCLAEEIIDRVGFDRLVEAGLDSGGDIEALDEDIQADLVSATFDAFEPCEIDITQLAE